MADPTPSPRPTAHRKPQNTNNLTHNPRTPHPAGPHQTQDHTPKTESGHRPNHPQPHTQTSHILKPAEFRQNPSHIHPQPTPQQPLSRVQIQDCTPKTESGHRTDRPRPRHHGLPPTQPSDLRHATTRKPPDSGAFACLSSDCYDHVMSRNRRHGRSLESVTPRRP